MGVKIPIDMSLSTVVGWSIVFVASSSDPFVARRRLASLTPGRQLYSMPMRSRVVSACQRRRVGTTATAHNKLSTIRPEIRRDYPLNLSILISGGKETNKDSLSNGE